MPLHGNVCVPLSIHPHDVCAALSSLAQCLCAWYVDPEGLYPFVASRLIALDKQPGVRPICVGETVRRLLGKAILRVIGPDVIECLTTLCWSVRRV